MIKYRIYWKDKFIIVITVISSFCLLNTLLFDNDQMKPLPWVSIILSLLIICENFNLKMVIDIDSTWLEDKNKCVVT